MGQNFLEETCSLNGVVATFLVSRNKLRGCYQNVTKKLLSRNLALIERNNY